MPNALMPARWRIRVCSVSEKPEFGRIRPNYAEQHIRVRSRFGHFFEKKNFKFLWKKKLFKNDSISDIIMQRRTYSNHLEKIWTKI